ncbi:EAL domain-containing protein [[Clostridium] symbiosum]|uniref:EAL domain-containing protein n=1 Tax=Clostridium symbiosum TaxID=1512 RepID=UPI00189B66E1|nr:EAL domain-containing protein [[Clostridium] symbiosum]MDB2019183.1 EAL domain-containing protein [[Clostridium] symbiosum]
MNLRQAMSRFQNTIYARAVRHGLTLAIPFLIMGSFALLLTNFPLGVYQDFIRTWMNGAASAILETLYQISLGSLALVLTVTISISYGHLTETDQLFLYPIVAVCSYLAFCGGIENQSDYIFNAEWVFTAMVITLLSCVLFHKILKLGHRFERLHTTGADYLFNISIQCLIPVILVSLFFAVTGYILRVAWDSSNITNFGSYLFLKLFDKISGNLFGILLYVVMTHLLWFMGIHGTNTLEAVSRHLFEQNVEINQSLVLAGHIPTEIFSKTFLDTFVFIGGCGTALSFVLALYIASKQSHNRKMSFVALPSALFNISEIAVFGFPIIFNLTMLIPFILTPVILTLISASAIKAGLVPAVTQSVEWTIPVLLSGYQATGSVSGSLLQLFNLLVGVFIYMPFVRRSEKQETGKFKQAVRQMEQDMAAGERDGVIPAYLSHKYPYYYYAKTLSMDLTNAMKRGQLQLFYQPQISSQGELHGMEALLRWNHPVTGYIAPPVLIRLAHESGILNELGYSLLDRACLDAQVIQNSVSNNICLSINISPKQLQDPGFFDKTLEIVRQYPLERIHIVLEITERAAMELSAELKKKMEYMKEQGLEFSLDDFGMGHNSLVQLQEGCFNEVKIDGNLVSQLPNNKSTREIISGIVQMSQNLNCRTIAEFVETEEQRDMLLSLGCVIYQGYYYSKALPPEEFLEYISRLPKQNKR